MYHNESPGEIIAEYITHSNDGRTISLQKINRK